ncbi:fasciclin domain-containing protein [Candidatus Poseidoniales archaeon]|nr:fasciclin domain-containing protein [Candidatus Poseidoniales archaeon]
MKNALVYLTLTLLIASTLPLSVNADANDDIPTNAAATGVHDSLVAALTHVDLVTTLQGTGPFTVFAPTDQAFTDAGIDLNDFNTQEEKDTLSDILLYHVVSGSVPSSAVTDGMLATMVNGDKAKFGVSGSTVTVGTATVTTADVQASNGIIHVIDKVLMPPVDIPTTAQTTGIHTSLVAAVIQADLLPTLQGTGPFTVFAPTDQAFTDAGIDLAALDNPTGKQTLSDILLYHVVSAEVQSSDVTDCMSADAANGQPLSFTVGSTVMVNDANVTSTDVVASNGLIHVIDKVLTPSDTPNNIPRTAQCTGIHNSLVAGVIQAELLETLQGTGPFTVFAPTDQAFIDAGIDLAALNTPEGKATLSDILLYHVVSGEVPSSAVTECLAATAVNGQSLSFTVGDGVMVNDANVTLADVNTSNGVIHVIDKVLTPTDTPNDIPRTAQCTGLHNSLVAGVIQAELLETLQGTGPFTVFAPTDQAFTDAGIDLASLDTPEGKAILSDILLYHVVAGNVPSSAVTECMSADAVNGQPLSFTVNGGVMVNGATVTLADVGTSNGVIHVIDKVLTPTDTPNDIPRTAQCTGVHNSLVAGVIQAELLPTLQGDGPFTVFAPTDQAFANAGIDLAALDTVEGKAALTDILLYHVIAGEVPAENVTECLSATAVNGNPLSFTVGVNGVMVNDANVTATDVPTSNGIIHVIDKVLSPTDTPNDIPRTAQCTGIHDTLVTAVVQAELLETLQSEGPFTLFAPTDQAFADAGIDLAALDTVEGKAALTDILLYHVVSGEVPSSAVTECMTTTAVNGNTLAFTVADGVMVNDATVTLADVGTSNGVIHVIDKVLSPTDTPNNIPRTAQCTGIHDSLVAAVIQAELLETLQGEGPFTLFAPTDQAFADAGIDLAALDTVEGKAALTDILLYHVVSGEVPSSAVTECMTTTAVNGQTLAFTVGDGVMVNDATVTLADVGTSNGVIHVIDKVLSPTDAPNNIPRTAQCTGIHDSLVAAVIQAELLETLQGEGPFTLFAPTDQAFADAGIDLATLNTPEGKAILSNILLHHVYMGSLSSTEITEGMQLEMANGDNTTLSLTTGINGANITLADVMASNGIIHVIDQVLIPPAEEDENTSGDGTESSEDEDSSWLTYVLVITGVIILGVAAGLLYTRRQETGEENPTKEYAQGGIINQLQPIDASSYASQQAVTQSYDSGYGQQAQAVQPVQPVVSEPVALQQWTDASGHTFRRMDDGSTMWWNGTDWQKYA